jgi:hypothetical protein
MQGGLTEGERNLREDWPVVDGSWRHIGVEELPCELVKEWRFLGSGVPVKQLRSRRKEMGIERERQRESGMDGGGRESKVSARNSTGSKSWHQMLGKTLLTKKAHKIRLMSIEQSLMAGPNCQAGWGKDGAAPSLDEEWLL